MRPTSSRSSAPAHEPLDPRVGWPPQQRSASGSGEAARLEGHRALLDLRDRPEDDRPDDRHDAADASPDRALGVQPSRSLRRRDLRRSIDHGRHRLHRCMRHEADARADPAPLEVDHQVGRPRREVEEGDRAADGQDAHEDLERELHALGGRRDRADPQQHRLGAGEEEQVDEEGRDGDRQRQQQGGADEPEPARGPRAPGRSRRPRPAGSDRPGRPAPPPRPRSPSPASPWSAD